ncbi:PstS family phosphate ABC transporter substrate-binding protein [Alistipes sp. ZOR0009]|jgi:phosphate transport system substrate-binding protein|uniref:PstS family phosphate ABC transporter substrate-binding protein n=1 Tax=Alistipes sp. ZOR0009 TaxID=1339253 RepID=UPI0006487A93|nr:PstS family phosphate ABC transporter substrate-binding protein [Alistipes sp. ZOR0009]
MNKTIILAAAALLVWTESSGQTIKIKGSDTTLPLTQKEAEIFMKTNKSARVSVTGGGSGVGVAALIDGSTDIAMSSRPLKMDERMKLKAAKVTYKQVVIANDALSVIVNPTNKISKLTRQQLEDIFTGKINNWKQVGGTDLRIVAYSRESSSGTYEFFKDHVMKKKNFANNVLSMSATGAVMQSVSQTKGAIGYVGVAYLEKKVKPLAVSFDGKTFIQPTVANATSGKYPITRPLFYFYNVKSEKVVAPFINFILSPRGQQIVKMDGYIPLK